MKKLITFLIVFLLSIPAFAQSVRDTKVRIRDRADAGDMATVTAYVADLGTTVYGVVSLSAGYFYDATTAGLRVINGALASPLPIAAMPTAPWSLNIRHYYDMSTSSLQLDLGNALTHDDLDPTLVVPYSGTFLHGFHASDGLWERLRLADHADGLATSLHGLVTASVMYGYNGATLDMLRVGASNELQVTDIATRPGEDAANDLRKVSKVDTGTYAPAKTTTTGIGATPTTVLASTQILGYPNVCVWLENDDGANPFTDADVFVSPNGTSWVDLSWVSCDSLAAGESCVYCISGNAYRYIKVEVTGAGGATVDVDAWLTGNKN